MKTIFIIINLLIAFYFTNSATAQTEIVFPKNNQIFHNTNPILFIWNKSLLNNSSNYFIQISTDINFNNILISTSTTSNTYLFIPPQANNYFVRVKSGYDYRWSSYISITTLNINNISGLKSWFSADTLINYTNDLVDSWTDIKDNSRIASQPSLVNRPLLENVCALNNKKGITFLGNESVPSYLELNSYVASSNYSVYMVRNLRPGNPAAQYVIGCTAGGFYAEQFNAGNGPGTNLISGTNYSLESIRDTNYAIYLHTDKAIFRNNKRISVSAEGTQTDAEIRFFGVRNGGGSLRIHPYAGTFLEFIYFDKILDSTNNNIIQQYFKAKYSPPVNLGIDTILGNTFCDSVVISAGCYSSYLWSNGKTTQSIKVLPNNSYSVTVRDVFGQISSDEISVYPYKRLSNKTIVICQGNSVTIDLQTPPLFSVLWNDNSSDKVKTFSTAGTYIVKLTDFRGCFIYDTVKIVTDAPKLSKTPILDTITVCRGEKLYVTAFSAFDSIRWSTDSTEESITITTEGVYSIYARTINGCILNQTFIIKIAGNAPTANFSPNTICQNSSTQLIDLSIPPSNSTITNWEWNFSNGNSSTNPSPSTIFTNLGAASASLKITTAQGCTDSIFKTFVVNKRPTPQFVNRKSCEGNPTLFQDQSIANAASITNWKWDFDGLGIINDIQNPAFNFPAANTYNVKLIVTNSNGCTDSVTNSLKVNQSPIADFSFDAACGQSPVNFRFLATVPVAPAPPQPYIASWNWDFGDNQFQSAIKDVQHVYGATGLYNVKLSVTSSEQCVDTIEKQVKVYDFPVVDFDISATQCIGKEIQFTDISQTPDGTPLTAWKWFFAGEGTASTQNSTHTFNTEGNYTIQLNATNAVGCSGTKLRSIAVSAKPEIRFTFSPQNLPAPLDVTYTNQSPTSGNYIWDYGDNTSPLFSGYNPPIHRYLTNGSYPIKLIATNFRGCTDTLTKYILVDNAYVDGILTSITITPNGDYYQIQATILNGSNIEIRDLGLSLQLGGGAVIRENWSGSLLPGQTTIYNFFGQIKISENVIPVICATIDNVNNNTPERKTDNNTTCKEVKVGSFDVLNVYPNPAFDVLNLGVMIPNDGKVSVRIVDALGQTFEKKDFNGIKGYNNFTMNTIQLNAAIYIAEVFYDGQVIRTKFMRKDRK